MSLTIKTYFDKDNTLYSNSYSNLGRNPITEVFYGDQYSRYILHFDQTRLTQLYNDKTIADLSKTKHYLKLYNCGSVETSLLGQSINDRVRGTSFDLVVYPLEQDFDEGIGYDFSTDNYVYGDKLISQVGSNWFYAQTLSGWTYPGASNVTGSTIIDTQHFDWGNENPVFDITTYVNQVITGGTTNYGLCIQYPTIYENTTTDSEQYVGFFSRHTHTFFEPHVETTYNETILDDRNKFYLDKTNRIYLYCNINNKPENLDVVPTCTISDGSTPTVYQATKGVYYVELTMSSATVDDMTMFYDTWSNLVYNGNSLSDVEMEFVTRKPNIYFSIGDHDVDPKDYKIMVNGIKQNEDVNVGDVRKMNVTASIPYTINQSDVIDGLEYRIYVKEGLGETDVINYTPVERTFNNNYFLIDTVSLLPHKYFIDIKMVNNQTVKHFKDVLSFNVVNKTELRYI